MENWIRDGSFKAIPGQEITEDVYSSMLNAMPPLRLPAAIRAAGFLMGEPYDAGNYGPLHLAFISRQAGGHMKYYYYGLSDPAGKEIKTE